MNPPNVTPISSGAAQWVAPGPPATLEQIEADLKRSGLTAADLLATPHQGGYEIPYWTLDGNRHPVMKRVRYIPNVAGQRYTQPARDVITAAGFPLTDAVLPYFNPLIVGGSTWATLAAAPGQRRWTLVEGEKKSVCCGKYLLYPAIGIGGCWNAVYEDAKTGAKRLHPELAKLFRQGDVVEIVFDGDLLTNENVELAAGTLRRVLYKLGIEAVFVLLPVGGGGLDDWIMAQDKTNTGLLRTNFDALPRTDGANFREDTLTLAHTFKLSLTSGGFIEPNERTVMQIVTQHERYRGRLWFDEVKRIIVEAVSTGAPLEMTDEFVTHEAVWLQRLISRMKVGTVRNVLFHIPAVPELRRNSVAEYLRALRWDGVQRLETMLIHGWGCPDNAVHRAIGRNWLVAAVARAMRPGCQVDEMVVLEGEQGTNKTKSLEILGGEWYRAISERLDTKDFKLNCHRGWWADLVEMSTFRYSDFTAAKGVITTRTDALRPPYGRAEVELPRHFILVGSTNEKQYLRDDTGNRRYLPVKTTKIDLDWIRKNKEQLYAEAVARYDAGETWWEYPPEIAAVQEAARETDAWELSIDDIIAAECMNPAMGAIPGQGSRGMYHFIPTRNILVRLGIPLERQHREHMKRIAAIMRQRPEWETCMVHTQTAKIKIIQDSTGTTHTFTHSCRGYRRYLP